MYEALGLPPELPRTSWPPDVTREQILAKVVHPALAIELGADKSVPLLHMASLCANLLDSFFETGARAFLDEAQQAWSELLTNVPQQNLEDLLQRSASACTYFFYERDLSLRIKRGERFLKEEVYEYLLRRGSDAPIYSSLLAVDGIRDKGITLAFRAFQALWDLADDISDYDQDLNRLGVNILRLGTGGKPKVLRVLAHSLARQGMNASIPKPLRAAVEREYARTLSLLN